MASIKELLQSMINKINGKNEGVDWNQNDETSPAFVKNRPFYTGEPVFTEIIPEQTYTLSSSEIFTMYADQSGTYPYSLEADKEYTVVYNGTTYELTSVNIEVPEANKYFPNLDNMSNWVCLTENLKNKGNIVKINKEDVLMKFHIYNNINFK